MSDAKQQSLNEELAALSASMGGKLPAEALQTIQAIMKDLQDRKIASNATKVAPLLVHLLLTCPFDGIGW